MYLKHRNSSNSSLQVSGTYSEDEAEGLQEQEMVDDFKETVSSNHIRTDAHMKSQHLWQHTQDICRFKPDKFLVLRRPSGHKVPTLTKKLFAVGTC